MRQETAILRYRALARLTGQVALGGLGQSDRGALCLRLLHL